MPFRTAKVNKLTESTVTGQIMAAGNGSQTVFQFTLSSPKQSTITIHYTIGATPYTATDNGSGVITGTNISSGAVDYGAGVVDITFSTAPDNSTNITADYTSRGLLDAVLYFVLGTAVADEVLYSQSGTATVFTGQAANNTPLSPGQVTLEFTISSIVYTVTDDGSGEFIHAQITSSSINYATGAIDITFATAPDNPSDILIDYIYGEEGRDWKSRMFETTKDNGAGVPFASTFHQCIISNTGYSGQESVIVGMREYEYPAGSAYGWDLNGYLAYNAGQKWNDNSSDHGRTTYNTTWKRWTEHPNLTLFNDVMQFWVYANKARIIVMVKVSSNYEAAYLGFLRRFGTKNEYPYPLLIAGSANGNINYASTGTEHNSLGFWTTTTTGNKYGAWMIDPANAYWFMLNIRAVPTHYLSITSKTLTKTTNTKALMQQVYIINNSINDNYGELDGVFYCPYSGAISEDVLQIGADNYKVFKNSYKNNYYDFISIKEE